MKRIFRGPNSWKKFFWIFALISFFWLKKSIEIRGDQIFLQVFFSGKILKIRNKSGQFRTLKISCSEGKFFLKIWKILVSKIFFSWKENSQLFFLSLKSFFKIINWIFKLDVLQNKFCSFNKFFVNFSWKNTIKQKAKKKKRDKKFFKDK